MKLFASDFDGTFSGKDFERNKEAVRRWREKGHRFAIVTGRDFLLSADFRRLCGDLLDYLVCCNGAAIYDQDGTLLFGTTAPADIILPTYEIACRYRADVFAVCGEGRRDYLPLEEELFPSSTAPEESVKGGPVYQITAHLKNHDDLDGYTKELTARFDGILTPQCNGTNCDAPAGITTKSVGVKRIAELAGCDEIYTIGDDKNDVPMIRDFYGFSLPHGVEETRLVAKKCVSSVAEAIDMLLAEN